MYTTEFTVHVQVQYIRTNGYAGWMVWALDLDDFLGQHCGQGTYPLMRTLNAALNE